MSNVISISSDTRPCDTEEKQDNNLSETTINPIFEHNNWEYHSVSQLKQNISYWVTDRLLLSMDVKNMKKDSILARYGRFIHELVQEVLFNNANQDQLVKSFQHDLNDRLNDYTEKDLFLVDALQTKYLKIYDSAVQAFKEMKIDALDTESKFSLKLKGLNLSIDGYVDFLTKHHCVELKTKWNRAREISDRYVVTSKLKNGEWSQRSRIFYTEEDAKVFKEMQKTETMIEFQKRHFQLDSAPTIKEPLKNDIMQVAVYSMAFKRKPMIIYATEKDSFCFTESNCDLLHKDNLKLHVERARRIASQRENLIKIVNGDVEKLTTIIEPPDLDDFFWDIGEEPRNEVKKIWKI